MRKTVIFSLYLLAWGAHFHASGLSDVLFSLSLSLSLDQSLPFFSNIFICEGPEKGFPPDSWKMEKTIFKLEGKNVNFHQASGD